MNHRYLSMIMEGFLERPTHESWMKNHGMGTLPSVEWGTYQNSMRNRLLHKMHDANVSQLEFFLLQIFSLTNGYWACKIVLKRTQKRFHD